MTAIELYKKLHSERNYQNDEISEALVTDELTEDEKETHAFCCLELDRLDVFRKYFGEEKESEYPIWQQQYAHANNDFVLGEIDYCIEYLLQLEEKE